MKFYINLFLIVVVSFSCDKDPEQNINPQFDSYVSEFFEEASIRGLNIELSETDITIDFGNLDDTKGGECNYDDNKITINTNQWDNLNEEMRKWLIFHELGHCVLNRRGHVNEVIGTGECRSVMKGTEDGFTCTTNFYSKLWWDYYLDELFDESATIPSWYAENNNYSSFNTDSVLFEVDTFSEDFVFEYPGLLSITDFKIDFSFENIDSGEKSIACKIDNIQYEFCTTCTITNARISINSNTAYENQNGDLQMNTNTKLSIVRNNDKLIFFVNERFVHTFESGIWQNEGRITSFSSEEITNMTITVSKLK